MESGLRRDKALLVGLYSLVVLNLVLNIVGGVLSFCLEGDSLPRAGLVEDLHLWSSSDVGSSAQVESGFPRR